MGVETIGMIYLAMTLGCANYSRGSTYNCQRRVDQCVTKELKKGLKDAPTLLSLCAMSKYEEAKK